MPIGYHFKSEIYIYLTKYATDQNLFFTFRYFFLNCPSCRRNCDTKNFVKHLHIININIDLNLEAPSHDGLLLSWWCLR